METGILKKQFVKREQRARGTKWSRLFFAPGKYLFSALFYKVIYPKQLKGLQKNASTFFGDKMEVVLPSGTDLYILGVKTHDSELRLTKYLLNHLNPAACFIDVGAHFGFFSLLGAQLVGAKGQVFAFEASEANFQVLSKNIAKHPAITCFNYAVGKEDNTTLTFFEFPIFYSEFNTRFADQYKGEEWFENIEPKAIEVQGITIDQFVSQQGCQPTMVKIDVEGAELDVLMGMSTTLDQFKPIIIFEFPTTPEKNEAHWKAVQWLESKNYFPHAIRQNGDLAEVIDLEDYLSDLYLESDNVVFICKS